MSNIQQLSENLWINHSELFTYHSGVFVSGSEAVVIDPGLSQNEIVALADFVRVQNWRVAAVILTHGDWDHILGASAFPDARVVAHRAYVDRVKRNAVLIQRLIEKTPDLGLTAPFRAPRADVTFETHMAFDVGALTLELFHTPGHAPDHLFVRDGAHGILWSADMLSNQEIPYIIDRLDAIETTLNALVLDNVQLLVPCHGDPTHDAVEIRARLENDRAYVGALRARVERAVCAGNRLDETKALCADIPYRQSVEENRGAHRRNVESAYAELGGQVDPDTVGWRRTLNEFAS